MLKQLVRSIKENPIQSILEMMTLLAIFAFGYAMLIVGSVITGNI
jgi:hypothetical protein|tara:strand:- start:321 stop:455 length:135 start_codon:yes stop_codon:yes gene_type:complete